MKNLRKNIFTRKINAKRLVMVLLPTVLVAGSIATVATVVTQDSAVNNKKSHIDHESTTGQGIPASYQDTDPFVLPQDGNGLGDAARDQLISTLIDVQGIINNLTGLSLVVTSGTLPEIKEYKTTTWQDAKANFANDLGLTSGNSTSFFSKLEQNFTGAQITQFPELSSSWRLGINFKYKREGTEVNGDVHATIIIFYDYQGELINEQSYGVAPSELVIKVSGIDHQNGFLTPLAIAEFAAALDRIQNKINALPRLSLQVSATSFPAITSEKVVNANDAAAFFVRDLGLSGNDATEFFREVNAVFGSTATSWGQTLKDGISFVYTRTGLDKDGTATALLKVVYDSPAAQHIVSSVTPTEITINVTGITDAINKQKEEQRNAVRTELQRITDMHLSGAVTTQLPAVNNQQVTDLTAFGLNALNLNNTNFIYRISHVAVTVSGNYLFNLWVVSKVDGSIISDPATVLFTATISGDAGVGGGGNGGGPKVGYIAGGVVGSLGVVGLTIFAGKVGYNRYINRRPSDPIQREFELLQRETRPAGLQRITRPDGTSFFEPITSQSPIDAWDTALQPADQVGGAVGGGKVDGGTVDSGVVGGGKVDSGAIDGGAVDEGVLDHWISAPKDEVLVETPAEIIDALSGGELGELTIMRPKPEFDTFHGPRRGASHLSWGEVSQSEFNSFYGDGTHPGWGDETWSVGSGGSGDVEIVNPIYESSLQVGHQGPAQVGDSVFEQELLQIRFKGQEFYRQLSQRLGGDAEADVFLVHLKQYAALPRTLFAQLPDSLSGDALSHAPGFESLPAELQTRALALFESLGEATASPEVAAGVLRELSGEFGAVASEIISIQAAAGSAVTEAVAGEGVLPTLFGRLVNVAEYGTIPIGDALALVAESGADRMIEGGLIGLLEHLV